ncbi:hypothetical protein F240042I4_34250 [Eisenbergiella tayi]
MANRLSFYGRIENGLVYLYLQNKTFVPKKKYKIKNKEIRVCKQENSFRSQQRSFGRRGG